MRRVEFLIVMCWGALVVGPGCTRLGFENRTRTFSLDGRPGDIPQITGDNSGPVDLPRRADEVADLFVEPLPRLVCAPPEVISPWNLQLGELTISTDGLKIYANDSSGIFRAERAAIGLAFGPWTFQGAPDGYVQDPDLFLLNGIEVSISADDNNSPLRYLQLCNGVFSACQRIEVYDMDQQGLITVDMDGPSVANIGDKLLMVFNVQPGDVATTDVFLGIPRDIKAPLVWDARRIENVNSPGLKDDDPAISSDGRILVFAVKQTGASNADLVAAYRADLTQLFTTPEVIANINSENGEGGPELFTRPSGEIEIYFNRYTSGSSRINGSLCELR